MKRYFCTCGQPLFFENSTCIACGALAAFDPVGGDMLSLEYGADGLLREVQDGNAAPWKLCQNANQCACNWIVSNQSTSLCEACTTTRAIPDLSVPGNSELWTKLETAKRRLLETLLDLELWGPHSRIIPTLPLTFNFLSDLPNEPVLTGHEDGLITINLAEADDAHREKLRARMHEPYRTLLGHFRHEVGHFYWDLLIQNSPLLQEYRALFGDETVDYQTAMAEYYKNGPAPDWPQRLISGYASMHSWEDWAETWAHYLHITDTQETAEQFGVASKLSLTPVEPGAFTGIAQGTQKDSVRFAAKIQHACETMMLTNELNRSMGLQDAYPFALPLPVMKKMFFIERVIQLSIGSTAAAH